MASDYASSRNSPEVDPYGDWNVDIQRAPCLRDSIESPKTNTDYLAKTKKRESSKSYRKKYSQEISICSDEECLDCHKKKPSHQKKRTPSVEKKIFKGRSSLYSTTKTHLPIISCSSGSEDSNRGTIGHKNSERGHNSKKVRNYRDNKTSSIVRTTEKTPKFTDGGVRSRSWLRKNHESFVSPTRNSKGGTRYALEQNKDRPRRRPRTPTSPDQSREKVPYFADSVRERDRLKKKYKPPSPVASSSRARSPKKRTPKRWRSRTRSRSRSASRHRKSSTDHRRHRRDESPYQNWPPAPQIITIPVPVPAFPPYHPAGWPPMPMPSARQPYFGQQRHRNNRQGSYNTTFAMVPPPPPMLPPMRHMGPYMMESIPQYGTLNPIRPPARGMYRFP